MTAPRPVPKDAMVVLEGVTRIYNGVAVLDNVSFAVERGEFISVLGPSGSGKSTLLRILAGFEQPDRGKLYIGGEDMSAVPPFHRDVGMVVQHFALFPHLNVLQNVEFGLEMRRVEPRLRRRAALEMLELVGLKGLEDRSIYQLSGGQRQRVALARALVTRPSVLLLDEPLGALDANLRVKMQGELKRLNKRLGITFILVTGNQSEAMAMSDRLVVLNRGRVEQVGTPHQVFRSPRTDFVARFMGNFNVLAGQVEQARDGVAVVRTAVGLIQAVAEGQAPRAGSRCSVLVRTDVPQLGGSDDAAGSVNRLSGRVAEVEFTGSLLAYLLELSDGTTFKVEKHRSLDRSLQETVHHGDQVTVSWPVRQTRLLLGEGDN